MAKLPDNKQIEDVFERLRRAQEAQERVAYKLAKSIETLSETALKDLDKNLRKLAKDSGALNDEQLALIKTADDLVDALDQQEQKFEKTIKNLDDQMKDLTKTIDKQEKLIEHYEARGNKQKADEIRLRLESIKGEIANLDAQKKGIEGFKAQSEALFESAEKLDEFQKHIDRSTAAVKGWVAKTLTLEKSWEMMKVALSHTIDELNKATAVGLQDSFSTIGYQAIKLKMSFDEFSEVIAKNRDIVRTLGGGTEGIKKFTDVLQQSSQNLAYMGKDGTKATARFIESMKVMGVNVKSGSEEFNATIKQTQDEFTKFSYIYGDTAEQFADLIDAQMSSIFTQSRMTGLTKEAAAQLRNEIFLRTENLKNLGLTNDQIKAFGERVDAAFDPKKNIERQKIQQSEQFKNLLSQLQTMQPENKELAQASAALRTYAEMIEGGATPDQIKAFVADNADAFKSYQNALDKNNQEQARLFKEGRKEEALMYQHAANYFQEQSGAVGEVAGTTGKEVQMAERKGLEISPEEARKQAETAMKLKNEQDLYTKTVMLARDVQQQYNSIMNASVTAMAAGVAVSFGALMYKTTKLGAAMDRAIDSLGKSLSGVPGAPGTPPAGKKGSKLGKLAKGIGVGAVGAISAFGLDYAGEKLTESGHDKLGATADVLGTAAGMAGTGAMIGSIVPGIGTGVGAAIGGLAGAGYGLYQNYGKLSKPQTPSVMEQYQPPVPPDATAIVRPDPGKMFPENSTIVIPTPKNVIDQSADKDTTVADSNKKNDEVKDRDREESRQHLPPAVDSTVTELKKQTQILMEIAQNTTGSGRVMPDSRTFKQSPAVVANQVG